MEKHNVRIDGKENTLTWVKTSKNGDRQYNTNGNESGHTFRFELKKGMRFRTSGHLYEILD